RSGTAGAERRGTALLRETRGEADRPPPCRTRLHALRRGRERGRAQHERRLVVAHPAHLRVERAGVPRPVGEQPTQAELFLPEESLADGLNRKGPGPGVREAKANPSSLTPDP